MAKTNLIPALSKWFLRQTFLLKRKSTPVRRLNTLSRRAVTRLQRTKAYRSAKTIALFMGFGSEIRTHELIRRCFQDGKTVLIPDMKRGMKKPRFVVYHKNDRLIQTGLGPKEVRDHRPGFPASQIDLIVVPGLAFDRSGHRLGFGGGVYDRLLEKSGSAVIAGLYYSFQFCGRLPREPHDRRLNLAATDKKIIRF